MMQAIMKLAFFTASRYQKGGYENSSFVYVPAMKEIGQRKKEPS